MASARRDPRFIALIVLLALTVIGGIALGFFGVGAQLAEEKTVMLTVLATELTPEVAQQVAVGDAVFTDPGGMIVGEIVEVNAGPWLVTVPDSEGGLHAVGDPVELQVEVVIETTGRESDDIVAVDNEVVQAGQFFALISRAYYLRSTVVDVDVR